VKVDDQGRAVLEGDGSFGFRVIVDGTDLFVQNARATWFGGDSDPLDSGETASGVVTKGNPDCMGCALPMDIGARSPKTQDSPFPKIPWQTPVQVHSIKTQKTIQVPLIDLGPAKPPRANAQIDLTVAAFDALGINHRAGEMQVHYRVLGGAQYLSADVQAAIKALG
jgi:hypothetical protein